MKKIPMYALLALLLTPSLVLAQTFSKTSAQAERSWQQFYSEFCVAVNKRDRKVLERLMANPFETNGGGEFTPTKWLGGMKSENWKQLQRSVALGTTPYGSTKGRPRRITKDKEAGCPIFLYGKDGRWRWVAILGD